MGYWTKLAEGIPPRTDHPLSTQFLAALLRVNPELYHNLEAKGELAAYVAVKVNWVFVEIRMMVDRGMSNERATETAMAAFWPSDPSDHDDEVQDYELEGAAEDDVAGLEKLLGESDANEIDS